jgi:tetratricopeptide (TPR) repeat protein
MWLLVLGITAGCGSAAEINWEKIRQLSAQGQHADAVQLAKNQRPTDAADHYNLGTLLKTAGKPGPALAHLEKASALDPWDSDIRTNLEIVRSEMESNLGKHRLDPESNPLERRVDGISLFVLQGVIGLVVLVSGLLILKPSRSSFPPLPG